MTEKKIDLQKSVFNKNQYIKTIDTSFNELGVTTVGEDIQNQPSVEDFFNLYDELFYDIPPNGPTNSHEYLVITSGEYINFEQNNVEIEALRAEIAQIRGELLTSQMENIKLQISGSGGDVSQIEKLKQELASANNALASSSEGLSQTIGDLTPEVETPTDPTSGVGYF